MCLTNLKKNMNKDIFVAKVEGKLLSLKFCFYVQWIAEHVDYVWYINSDKMNSLSLN